MLYTLLTGAWDSMIVIPQASSAPSLELQDLTQRAFTAADN